MSPAARTDPSYPNSLRVELDRDTVVVDGVTLVGGSPLRVLRLSTSGGRALASLRDRPAHGADAARLARLLTDAGLAHPVLGPPAPVEASVLIPVRDRPAELARCLSALGASHPVLVVDDGSRDVAAVAAVCARHGARLIARPANGGPAAARNTGLREITTPYVLLLDSDCVPPPDLLPRLAAHLVDPLVAAVAPRVTGLAAGGEAGALDLGERPARVAPGSRIGYVPSAALLLRRAALEQVGVFDPALRYGEDVDLVWRLVRAGWRVRYEPAVVVAHQEPTSWSARLRRRFAYGTSAGPLARRHPGSVPPLVLSPWSALTAAGVLTRRPLVGAAGLVGSTVQVHRVLAARGVPPREVVRTAWRSTVWSWLGLSRAATQFGWPALAAALMLPGRRAGGRRAVVALLLLSSAVLDRPGRGGGLEVARRVASRLADDIAYGAGVVAGSVRARTVEPVLPVVRRRTPVPAPTSTPNARAQTRTP